MAPLAKAILDIDYEIDRYKTGGSAKPPQLSKNRRNKKVAGNSLERPFQWNRAHHVPSQVETNTWPLINGRRLPCSNYLQDAASDSAKYIAGLRHEPLLLLSCFISETRPCCFALSGFLLLSVDLMKLWNISTRKSSY